MEFLTTSPLWVAGVLLVGLLSLVAMAGPILVRRRWTLERLETNNEVAGFKFATVGVLYAVLLAFAVIVVWEKFTEADDRVAAEAGAAATIYRLADGMGGDRARGCSAAITAICRRRWPTTGRRWTAAPPAPRRQGRSTPPMRRSFASSRSTSTARW